MAAFREMTALSSRSSNRMREMTKISSRSSTRSQSKSVTTEIHCSPCSRDGQHHEAEGYCIDCAEYFCTNCIKHHKNLKITQNHVLRDRRAMPKYRSITESDQDDEVSMELCDIHGNEMLRYYCKDHDEPCCSVCATLKHRQCKDILYIPDIKAKQINKQSEGMIKNIKTLITQVEKVRDETNHNIDEHNKQKDDFQKTMQKVHSDIMALLHHLETMLVKDVNQVHEDEKSYLISRAELCDDIVRSLEISSDNLDIAIQNGIESKTFLQLKKTTKQVKQLEAQLEAIKQKNSDVLQFKFQLRDQIRDFIKHTTSLGTLEIMNRPTRSAEFLKEFKVTSSSDPYQVCQITGCTVLADGRIALVDMYNQSLKLFGTDTKLAAHTKLSAEPWDITAVSSEQVIISLPQEKKLQFFQIGRAQLNPKHKIGPTVTKSSQFHGVEYYENRLYVTCPKDEPPCVKILDMQGNELHIISSSPRESNLFRDPLYLTMSHNGKVLYVSDSGNNTIVGIQLHGDGQIRKFQEPENRPIGGIIAQTDGNMYVCGFKTKTIVNLTRNCKFVGNLIGKEGGLKKPQALCYIPMQHQLLVTMQKSDKVKVFQLS